MLNIIAIVCEVEAVVDDEICSECGGSLDEFSVLVLVRVVNKLDLALICTSCAEDANHVF